MNEISKNYSLKHRHVICIVKTKHGELEVAHKQQCAYTGTGEPGWLRGLEHPTARPQFQAKNKKLSTESNNSELQDFKNFRGRIPKDPLDVDVSGARLWAPPIDQIG